MRDHGLLKAALKYKYNYRLSISCIKIEKPCTVSTQQLKYSMGCLPKY
jgi:hypothetical protein